MVGPQYVPKVSQNVQKLPQSTLLVPKAAGHQMVRSGFTHSWQIALNYAAYYRVVWMHPSPPSFAQLMFGLFPLSQS